MTFICHHLPCDHNKSNERDVSRIFLFEEEYCARLYSLRMILFNNDDNNDEAVAQEEEHIFLMSYKTKNATARSQDKCFSGIFKFLFITLRLRLAYIL